MNKVNRNSVKGELYNGRDFVGSIVKVETGYQIWKIECGLGAPILDGRVFKGTDFRSAGQLDLGYAVVKKFEMAA